MPNLTDNDNHLSIGERICRDFNRYIVDLVEKKRGFFLPYKINKIKLRDVGIFDRFEIDFKSFNVVHGSCGKGKTTLFRSIAYAFDLEKYPKDLLLRKDSHCGNIEIEFTKRSSLNLWLNEEAVDYEEQDDDCVPLYGERSEYNIDRSKVKGLILDDAGDCLTKEKYQDFLGYLRELNQDLQIILTVRVNSDRSRCMFSTLFSDCNFIDLDSINSQERLF